MLGFWRCNTRNDEIAFYSMVRNVRIGVEHVISLVWFDDSPNYSVVSCLSLYLLHFQLISHFSGSRTAINLQLFRVSHREFTKMGITTGLLIVVVFYVCHQYRSTVQQIELLEQNYEKLEERTTRLEGDESDQSNLVGVRVAVVRVEIAKLKKRIAFDRAEVEGLERLVRAYKEEDQEDKLCLIEGMKKIGRFLGLDDADEEVVEDGSVTDVEDEDLDKERKEVQHGLQDCVKIVRH